MQVMEYVHACLHLCSAPKKCTTIQGGSNMTRTNLYVNKCKQSRSYLNHLVYKEVYCNFGLLFVML